MKQKPHIYILVVLFLSIAELVRSNERIGDSDDERIFNATKQTTEFTTKLPDVFTFDRKITESIDLNRLRHLLLFGYDKNSRPVFNSTDSLLVKIGVNVAQINGLDEDFQIMISTLQISFRWNDQYLRWNKSIYSSSIFFKSHEIWTPDIIALNNLNNIVMVKESLLSGGSISIFDPNERTKYLITVKSNGDCRWVFPMKLMSNCQLDQMYFPFDTQKCNIDFGSTAYSDGQLKLRPFKKEVHTEMGQKTEFDLLKAKYIYQNDSNKVGPSSGDQPAIMMRTQVIMKRKMTFYLNKIIMPYFTFYVVTVFTYLIPVESGEKKSYCTSILISGFIYLKDTSSYIPKSKNMPMITIYFDSNLIFVFVCVISSTIVYNIYFMGKTKKPLPYLLKKLIQNNWITKWVNFGPGNLLHETESSKTKLEIKPSYLTDLNAKLTAKKENNDNSDIKYIIQNELNEVNNQLLLLKENFNMKDEIFSKNITGHRDLPKPEPPEQKESKTKKTDLNPHQLNFIGHEMLTLLKTFNKVIKSDFKHVIESDIKTYDTMSDWIFFLLGLRRKTSLNNKQDSYDVNEQILKQNIVYTKKAKKNFHYVNTLENLKFALVNPEQSKKKLKKLKKLPTMSATEHAALNVDSVKVATKYLNALNAYKNQMRQFMNIHEPSSEKQLKQAVKTTPLPEPDYSKDWKLLAILIDRLIFITFSLIIPICLILMYVKVLIVETVKLD